MTHPALYLPTGRIPFIPTRIVRAFNDNVAAGPLLTAADGASVAHLALCRDATLAADLSLLHSTEVAP